MIFKKCKIKRSIAFGICFCLLSIGFLSGCIHEKNLVPISSGQSVALSYTCKLGNGEPVSATDVNMIAKLQADPFSIFIGPGLTDHVVIQAGKDTLSGNWNSQDKLRDFQAVLKNEIGKRVVGMRSGKAIGMSLLAEDTPELSSEERFIRMAKQRIRPKKKTLSFSSFGREGAGDAPTLGKDMTRSAEPWLEGKVTAMDGTSVTVMYSATVGETIETPFGPALISENETEYIVNIKPVIGKLVRTGGFLGRIVAVDEEMFTIDFGNPFAGERIYCDVTAEAVLDQTLPGGIRDRMTSAVSVDSSTMQAVSGDLVAFDYTLLTRDGALVMTSRRSDNENKVIKKSRGYEANTSFGPVQIVLGRNEIVPFIENALYGMKAGEKKKLHLEPKDAYGEKDPKKIRTFPRVKTLPEVIDTTREEFRKRFNADPQPGKQIQVVPLFQSKVVSVDGDRVVIKHVVEDGTAVPGDLGSTEIVIKDGKIVMTLLPNSGAGFEANGEHGIMAGYDEESFVVDFNTPHAGEAFFLDVDARSVVKKAAYEKNINWENNLDEVFEDIDSTRKPAVLVLYASWCGWSKKLLSETLKDPRITSLSDRFLWLKVDTDKDRGIYELYEQKSYPMVVLLKNNGEVYRKLEGFTNAANLSKALNDLL